MKISFKKKSSLISMCIILLLASILVASMFPRVIGKPSKRRVPEVPRRPPRPNPKFTEQSSRTQGPAIDELHFQVIKGTGSGGPPTEQLYLYVDGFTADAEEWTTVGTEPWLDASEDGNYIEAPIGFDGAMIGWFTFEDIVLPAGYGVSRVTLEGYTDGPYEEGVDFDTFSQNWAWLGSLYAAGEPAWVGVRWTGASVNEAEPSANTEEGLNALMVLVMMYDPDLIAVPGNIIDCLRLKVTLAGPGYVPSGQVMAMQDHYIDVLTDLVKPENIEKLDGECNTITSAPGFHIAHIGFNIRADQAYRGRPEVGPVLSDVYFRLACFYGYNQLSILATIYNYTVRAVNSLVPPAEAEWYNSAVAKPVFNLGDKTATTEYPADKSTAGVLRYAGYLYSAAKDNWVTPYDLDEDGTPGTNHPNRPLTILDADDVVPDIHVYTPTYEIMQMEAEHGARFIGDLNSVGLTSIRQKPDEFWPYLIKVYEQADFDMFMMFHKLGRYPLHLYNMLHSSQDCHVLPWGDGSAGVNHPKIDELTEDLKFGMDHDHKVESVMTIQEMLYDHTHPDWAGDPQAYSYMVLYSRVYINAFNPGLRGIVNSTGFGSNNMWTFLNMHWEPGHPYERDGTVIWCLGDEPERLNPIYAGTVYAKDIIEKTLDSLTAVSPYNHTDIPWIAYNWDVFETPADPYSPMHVTFYLRDDVYWQDGHQFTAQDVKFGLDFLKNYQIPQYYSTWENIVNVTVVNDFEVKVYSDTTSQFLVDYYGGAGSMLPPQVWDRDWENWPDPDRTALQNILGYDPTEPYNVAPGYTAGPTPPPTNLFGTGPFIFDYYDPIGMYGELDANPNYFMATTEIQDSLKFMLWTSGDVNQDGVIDQVDRDRMDAAMYSTPVDPNWDPDCDLNSDGLIDIRDSLRVEWYFGERREYPVEIIDVAILDVTAFPTVVLPGQKINITVIAKNKGNAGFTTNFTYYYDNTFIENQTVTNLIPCHNTTLHYLWDTTGVTPGTYTLTVNATVTDGVDINLTDNTFIDGIVKIGTTEISVNPEKSIVGSAGKNFSVNIIITDAPYNTTWAWQFRLGWNASLLNVTDITEGAFLNQNNTWNTAFATDVNQEEGWVLVSCTLYEDPIQQGQPLTFGNGTLATINLTVLDTGNCTLHLYDTVLLDYDIDPYDHTTKDGEFVVLLGDINRDGIVDEADMEIIKLAFGSAPGDPNWNPEADIWGSNDEPDGLIDIYDLAMWGKKYGETA